MTLPIPGGLGDRERLVGLIALALERGLDGEAAVPAESPLMAKIAVCAADAVLKSRVDSSEWQFVPTEPTDAMLIAAMEATLAHFRAEGIDRNSPFERFPKPQEQLLRCWAAMLGASPLSKLASGSGPHNPQENNQ